MPWERSGMVVRGEAEGAGALQFVFETPAEEGGLLGHFASPGVLVVLIVGQTDHGVGLWQVPAEGGTLGGLDRRTDGQTRSTGVGFNRDIPVSQQEGAGRPTMEGLLSIMLTTWISICSSLAPFSSLITSVTPSHLQSVSPTATM